MKTLLVQAEILPVIVRHIALNLMIQRSLNGLQTLCRVTCYIG